MIAATMIASMQTLAALQGVAQRDLGKAEGACRTRESGPAFVIDVEGLRDRTGLLKLEVYPARDGDFLADDTKLVAQGQVFRRVEAAPSSSGSVRMCIRVPVPGRYSISLLHDRTGDHRFTLSSDGIGFAGNPKLGWSKPSAASAAATAGAGPTSLRIRMNYRHGLSMRPDKP